MGGSTTQKVGKQGMLFCLEAQRWRRLTAVDPTPPKLRRSFWGPSLSGCLDQAAGKGWVAGPPPPSPSESHVPSSGLVNWRFDAAAKGPHIVLSADGLTATSHSPNTYESSTVLGTVDMHGGTWHWKLRMRRLRDGVRAFYGVTQKPFNHHDPCPYHRVWGWGSTGALLPGHDRCVPEGRLQEGDEVWLRYEGHRGRLTALWPRYVCCAGHHPH